MLIGIAIYLYHTVPYLNDEAGDVDEHHAESLHKRMQRVVAESLWIAAKFAC